MAYNFITKGELGFFYENRKKLDDAIGQILGPEIHLHDISQESSQRSQNEKKKTNKAANNATPTRKSQKIEDFYTSVSNQNKLQKLYKENIELQKKMMNIKDQNQAYKQKAALWQKIKYFIINSFDKQHKLKSVRFNSSDASILQQFITVLQDVLPKSKGFSSNRNMRIEQGQKDHAICRQLQEDAKRKFQEESRKVSKLAVQVQVLRSENKVLREKQDRFKVERIARISQLQTGIQVKFEQIQKSLHEKTEENKFLVKKIASLESQLFQAKGNLSPLRQKDKERTISTTIQSNMDKTQIDFLKQLSKTKDSQINILKYESKQLNTEVANLKNSNQKMKTVIRMAQNLNNEFISKLEDSIKKNQTLYQYGHTQYQIEGPNLQKNQNQKPQQQFHFVNQRFKLLKSRSVEKQKYVYGQKLKI